MIYAIDDFGAVGDGIVSDTEAYLKAVEKAIATDVQTIYLTEGTIFLMLLTLKTSREWHHWEWRKNKIKWRNQF